MPNYEKCIRCGKQHSWSTESFNKSSEVLYRRMVLIFCDDCKQDYMDGKLDDRHMNDLIEKYQKLNV